METLGRFMVNGFPDETLFKTLIGSVIRRAQQGRRKVRAFGEMVGLLSIYGHHEATLRLEHFWNDICKNELLSLFCAYPKIAFIEDAPEFLSHVCAAHSKVLPA